MIREVFVQESLESYFTKLGYRCKHEKHGVDLYAERDGSKTWIIEAKGETPDNSNTRVDFCTCVGQLAGRIKDSGCNYGIAVPKTKPYINQARQLSLYFRKQLNIHILIVSESGDIEIITPDSDEF